MKKIIYLLLGAALLLSSCFEDEGNYDYKELNAPQWVQDFSKMPCVITAYGGSTIALKGSALFEWKENAEQRAKEVRYEWEFYNKIVSEDLDCNLPVSEFMEITGVYDFDKKATTGRVGTFRVIEKETGITYMAKLQLYIYPYYAAERDWFILSDDNGKTNISSIRERRASNQDPWKFSFIDHAYEHHNGGAVIPGKPLYMSWAKSSHVGTQGSLTVLTDQAAYEIKADDLTYFGELKDMFLDGSPADFQPTMRADIDAANSYMTPSTFVVNKDGQVFTRVMTKGYLGGKFLSDPYVMDKNGYCISYIGQTVNGGDIPCYDSKNRRVVIARESTEMVDGVGEMSRVNMVPLKNGLDGLPLHNFPEGVKVLNISKTSHISPLHWFDDTQLYTIVYTDPAQSDKTFIKDFKISPTSMRVLAPSYDKTIVLGQKLTEETKFIMSGSTTSYDEQQLAKKRIYFTNNNKLYCLQRNDFESSNEVTLQVLPYDFPAKITALNHDGYWYNRLWVGCENGEFFVVRINYWEPFNMAQVEYKNKVSGKVMAFKQLCSKLNGDDNF